MVGVDGVAQPHRRVVVDAADGQVLGHPFREPQRHHRERRAVPPQDIALKRVHEFVPEDVIGFRQPGRKGQDDASGLMIGEAADAVAEQDRRDRRLREMSVAGVQDDRLAAIELMIEGSESFVYQRSAMRAACFTASRSSA